MKKTVPVVMMTVLWGTAMTSAAVASAKQSTGVFIVDGQSDDGFGRMKDSPSPTDKGSNLLAIAYAKAAEMADTLKDSGSRVRPPMTGEYGWNGGVIVHGKRRYLIAAFSGGKDQDDVSISRTGVAVLENGL